MSNKHIYGAVVASILALGEFSGGAYAGDPFKAKPDSEPVRNLVRATGHGWGRSVHYYNPGYHSCYYNPWTSSNTARFAYGFGEPDCYGLDCGQVDGYAPSNSNNSANEAQVNSHGHPSSQSQLPPRVVTEPQFPSSRKATVKESDDSAGGSMLDGFSGLNPPATSQAADVAGR